LNVSEEIKKQASQIQNAEKLVADARQYLESLNITQQEVDAKAKEISSLTAILKSIKAEETVKENKNQDSRNGKKTSREKLLELQFK
jgi:hypothetical protein